MNVFIIILVGMALIFLIYTGQKKSRKMFIKNMLKQVIYLVPRYFA